MQSSISLFNNEDLIKFVENLGIKVKCERGNRVFLACDDATKLTLALKKELVKLNINVRYQSDVIKICASDNKITAVELNDGAIVPFDIVVIATGGMSYPATGSNGSGYKLAKQLGHTITTLKPALVNINAYDTCTCKQLEGVSIKNTALKVFVNGKKVYEDFGEFVFTNSGVSGPVVLSASSILTKINNIEELFNNHKVILEFDMKPALSDDNLYQRITRDFEKYHNKDLKNAMKDLTISSMISIIINMAKLNKDTKINTITKEEKKTLVNVFKQFRLEVKSLSHISTGIITSGGIKTSEINPKTMESKLINGLYFAGEVIDVDAFTGGFNLQIAFTTGYACGKSIGQKI